MTGTSSVASPPEVVDAAPLVLRRAEVKDAEGLARAVSESLGHLAPWMPWATPEAATQAAQAARLSAGCWGPDEYDYLMTLGGTEIVGACALHREAPSVLAIGYWVHVRHVRHGFATAAAGALARTALSMAGTLRVNIRCDEANVASAAVPRRLGFRLDRVEGRPIDAPAQTGRSMTWVMERGEREAR